MMIEYTLCLHVVGINGAVAMILKILLSFASRNLAIASNIGLHSTNHSSSSTEHMMEVGLEDWRQGDAQTVLKVIQQQNLILLLITCSFRMQRLLNYTRTSIRFDLKELPPQ